MRPPVDAIRQFQVLTSTYDASFGRNAGGQINVITQIRRQPLLGLGVRVLPQRLARRSQLLRAEERAGAATTTGISSAARSAGHWFGIAPSSLPTTSGTHLREGITRVTNVPTLAERTGDFSQTLFNRPFNFLVGQPFPGGMIPPFFQSPIGRVDRRAVPRAEPRHPVCELRLVADPRATTSIRRMPGSIIRSAAAARLTGALQPQRSSLVRPVRRPGVRRRSRVRHRRPAAWTEPRVPSLTRLIARGQRSAIRLQPRVDRRRSRKTPQTSNAVCRPAALSPNPRDAGLSVISIAGYSPLGPRIHDPAGKHVRHIPAVRHRDAGRAATTFSRLAANGTAFVRSAYRDVQSRGFLTFVNQGYTGNALADLLLGLPVLTGGAQLDNPQNLRAHSWSLFAQDDWRPVPVADDFRRPALRLRRPARRRRQSGQPVRPATGQLVQVGTGIMPRGGYAPDRNNFGPRAGFAWAIDSEREERDPRRLRHLLQPGSARDVRRAVSSTRPTST